MSDLMRVHVTQQDQLIRWKELPAESVPGTSASGRMFSLIAGQCWWIWLSQECHSRGSQFRESTTVVK